jgi:predicted DNA-binding protein
MSVMSLRLPDSIHARARALSKRDRVSVNSFVASAVAEKISAFETEDYLSARAVRGSKAKFLSALACVPDQAPPGYDRL